MSETAINRWLKSDKRCDWTTFVCCLQPKNLEMNAEAHITAPFLRKLQGNEQNKKSWISED